MMSVNFLTPDMALNNQCYDSLAYNHLPDFGKRVANYSEKINSVMFQNKLLQQKYEHPDEIGFSKFITLKILLKNK